MLTKPDEFEHRRCQIQQGKPRYKSLLGINQQP